MMMVGSFGVSLVVTTIFVCWPKAIAVFNIKIEMIIQAAIFARVIVRVKKIKIVIPQIKKKLDLFAKKMYSKNKHDK